MMLGRFAVYPSETVLIRADCGSVHKHYSLKIKRAACRFCANKKAGAEAPDYAKIISNIS